MDSTNNSRVALNLIKNSYPQSVNEACNFFLGARGTAEYGSLFARVVVGGNGIKLNDAYLGANSISEVGTTCILVVYYR